MKPTVITYADGRRLYVSDPLKTVKQTLNRARFNDRDHVRLDGRPVPLAGIQTLEHNDRRIQLEETT